MELEQLSLNRTQRLVLGFFIFAWVALIAILAAAPEVCDQALYLPGGERNVPTLAFLSALSAFLVLLGVGVVRRWWPTFWLVLISFLIGGANRVPRTTRSARLRSPEPSFFLITLSLPNTKKVIVAQRPSSPAPGMFRACYADQAFAITNFRHVEGVWCSAVLGYMLNCCRSFKHW